MSDHDFKVISNWTPTDFNASSGSGLAVGPTETELLYRIARLPLLVLILANCVWLTVNYVSEVQRWLPIQTVLGQIDDLAVLSGEPAAGGSVHLRIWATCALMLALVYVGLVRTSLRWVPILMVGLALLGSAALVVAVLPGLIDHFVDKLTGSLIALSLGVAWVSNGFKLMNAGEIDFRMVHRRPGLWLLFFLLTAATPLALGRFFFGHDATRAALAVANTSRSLWTGASVLYWLSGAAFGVTLWCLERLLPPWSGRKIAPVVVLLILAVGPGLGLGGYYALRQPTHATQTPSRQSAGGSGSTNALPATKPSISKTGSTSIASPPRFTAGDVGRLLPDQKALAASAIRATSLAPRAKAGMVLLPDGSLSPSKCEIYHQSPVAKPVGVKTVSYEVVSANAKNPGNLTVEHTVWLAATDKAALSAFKSLLDRASECKSETDSGSHVWTIARSRVDLAGTPSESSVTFSEVTSVRGGVKTQLVNSYVVVGNAVEQIRMVAADRGEAPPKDQLVKVIVCAVNRLKT